MSNDAMKTWKRWMLRILALHGLVFAALLFVLFGSFAEHGFLVFTFIVATFFSAILFVVLYVASEELFTGPQIEFIRKVGGWENVFLPAGAFVALAAGMFVGLVLEEVWLGVALGCALAGLSGLVYGFEKFRQKTQVQRAPLTPLGQMSPGFVCVRGTVTASQANLTSPVSQEACVYYHTRVQIPDANFTRALVFEEIKGDSLVLEDDTGKAIVSLQSPELLITTQTVYEGDGKDNPRISEFLASHSKRFSAQEDISKFIISETAIIPGDQLVVIGTAAREGGGSLVISRPKAKSFFYISDQSYQAIIDRLSLLATAGIGGAVTCVVGVIVFFFA